jgi:hypothetical protein
MSAASNPLYCSFCAKSQNEVTRLVAGPTVFICNECVDLCFEICKDLEGEDEKDLAAAWLRRTSELRTIVESLTSSDADVVQPICGRWVMRAGRDSPDGPVKVVLQRRSGAQGDISIAFDETVDDLIDIAKWIAAAQTASLPSHSTKTRIVDQLEMSVSISGKALLHEFERRAEQLKLAKLAPSPPPTSAHPLPFDLDLIRSGLRAIVERHPEYRSAIADALRLLLNDLAYTR